MSAHDKPTDSTIFRISDALLMSDQKFSEHTAPIDVQAASQLCKLAPRTQAGTAPPGVGLRVGLGVGFGVGGHIFHPAAVPLESLDHSIFVPARIAKLCGPSLPENTVPPIARMS